MAKLKIGLIKEGKTPIDRRVPLTPNQAAYLSEHYPVEVYCQSSDLRAYSDQEYKEANIPVVNDVSHCDIMLGVKEVPKDELIPGKTYFFFSHTIKKQPYNRDLLREILRNNIRLIDYEVLKYPGGERIVAFGRYAGIVGAYNGLIAYGKKHDLFDLPRAFRLFDLEELFAELDALDLPAVKIALTGGGRVANGAVEVLSKAGCTAVSVDQYLNEHFSQPVFCQLLPGDYNRHIEGKPFDLGHFFSNPAQYESNFTRFLPHTDMLIAGAYWDPSAPKLFDRSHIDSDNFRPNVIADITCDIRGSIPSTVRPSAIDDPFYDYRAAKDTDLEAFTTGDITVMAVDNLPNELPRDASRDFGDVLSREVLPLLLNEDKNDILEKATITRKGALGPYFEYLSDYVNE